MGGSYSRGPLSLTLTKPASHGARTDPHQGQHAPPGSELKPVSALDEAERQVQSCFVLLGAPVPIVAGAMQGAPASVSSLDTAPYTFNHLQLE